MIIKIMYGSIKLKSYYAYDVRCIVSLTGRDLISSGIEYNLCIGVKLYSGHAYLCVVNSDGHYDVYSSDCMAEFS